MELDYPKVRAQVLCPLCVGDKDEGLLVCWPCYRRYELRSGNEVVEQIIAQAENGLVAQAARVI